MMIVDNDDNVDDDPNDEEDELYQTKAKAAK